MEQVASPTLPDAGQVGDVVARTRGDEQPTGIDGRAARQVQPIRDLERAADVAAGGLPETGHRVVDQFGAVAGDLVVTERKQLARRYPVPGEEPLLAAETVDTIAARQTATVVAETAQHAELAVALTGPGVCVDTEGDRLVIRGITKAAVSQVAFEHGIQLVELRETAPTLEDTLLDMTGAFAEFASA